MPPISRSSRKSEGAAANHATAPRGLAFPLSGTERGRGGEPTPPSASDYPSGACPLGRVQWPSRRFKRLGALSGWIYRRIIPSTDSRGAAPRPRRMRCRSIRNAINPRRPTPPNATRTSLDTRASPLEQQGYHKQQYSHDHEEQQETGFPRSLRKCGVQWRSRRAGALRCAQCRLSAHGYTLVHHHFPRERPHFRLQRESQRPEQLVHHSWRMDEGTEWIAKQAAEGVSRTDHRTHRPPVAGIRQAIQPPAALGGQPHQRLHLRIAADHAVERDDIGRGHLGREGHEVAELKLNARAHTAPLRLRARSLLIRAGCVDRRDCPGPSL